MLSNLKQLMHLKINERVITHGMSKFKYYLLLVNKAKYTKITLDIIARQKKAAHISIISLLHHKIYVKAKIRMMCDLRSANTRFILKYKRIIVNDMQTWDFMNHSL